MPTLYREFTTQQELDAQYDVEKAVPDFTIYARHYIDESKLARHRLACELDVRYGPTRDEHLDIFRGARREAPILMFFHGGYWRMLSSKEFSCVALGPVSAGATVLVVNYSLTPKVTVDEIVRQCRAAVAWAYRNAESFGGDRERITLTGHSAGGQITAMCLATDWAGEYGLPVDLIKGAFPISGVFDLRPIRFTLMQPVIQLTEETIQRMSPIFHVPKSKVPIIVSYGGAEPAEFARQSRAYFDEWQRQGNQAELWVQAQENHFDAIYGFEDAKSALCRKLFRLMGMTDSHAPR